MRLSRIQLQVLAGSWAFLAAGIPASAQVWQDLGPGRIPNWRENSAGRVSAVAAHPTTATTYYLGGADEGVWKTTNDGGLWTPLTDTMPTNAIGCITVDPTNANRIYVGTGEVNRNRHTRYGLGVYRSEDGGTTWVHLPRSGGVHVPQTFDGRCIARICVNPSNPSQLFAGVTRSVGDRHGKRHPNGGDAIGLYKSSDYGESWVHVPAVGGTGWNCTDVAHISGNIFLAAAWQEPGIARIYRTTDAGLNWVQVGGTFTRRIALAVATGGMIVWALDYPDSPDNAQRLWRSADYGMNWTEVLRRDTGNGMHMMVLAVNPSVPNKAYFGGQFNQFEADNDIKRF